MRLVRSFLRFWWDFVVGDDWKVAAGVAAALVAGGLAESAAGAGTDWVAPVFGVALALAFVLGLAIDLRRR